jgi:hypothetical protein
LLGLGTEADALVKFPSCVLDEWSDTAVARFMQKSMKEAGAKKLTQDGLWGVCTDSVFQQMFGEPATKASLRAVGIECGKFYKVPPKRPCPAGEDYVTPPAPAGCPEGQVYLPGVGCQGPTVGGFITKIPSTPAEPSVGWAITSVCGAGKVKDAQGNCVTPSKPIDYSPYAAAARALAAKQAAAPTLSSTARFAVLPKLRISDLPKERQAMPLPGMAPGSRAWLWGLGAVALLVGGVVVYKMTRKPGATPNCGEALRNCNR